MKTRKITLLSAAAMALGATLLLTQSATAADEKTKLNNADAQFLQDEAAAGAAMVKMAKVGEKNAQSKEVKAFAGKLVADHTKSNAKLASLAASKGVRMPVESDDAKNSKLGELQETNSVDFDKKFVTMMVRGHEKCVKNFKDASRAAGAPRQSGEPECYDDPERGECLHEHVAVAARQHRPQCA